MNDHIKHLRGLSILKIIIFSWLIVKNNCIKDSEVQCILQNTYWDSIISKEDFIKDPSQCHNVSSNCCYMNLNYTYNAIPFNFSYCFTMKGRVEDIVRKFLYLLQDDLRWYANSTYNNFQIFKSVGNNLEYVYYSNYTCTTPDPYKLYNSYDITFCALFNADGSCAIVNDDENFNQFVLNMYQNATSSQCGFTAEDGTCLGIGNLNLLNSTSSSLVPLLENLKIALNVDGGGYPISNGTKLITGCQPIPIVNVKVICPDTYTVSSYFKVCNYLLYLVLLFLIYI